MTYTNESTKGKNNRTSGKIWEEIIDNSCKYYLEIGLADIEKTPEPMRVIQNVGKGRFMCCFRKMAQPDYKGTLKGGKAIVFEAKHTDTDKMNRNVISEEQEKRLDSHYFMGAECFVLISFKFNDYFRVPWDVFRDMKSVFGRKYVTINDLEKYRIKMIGMKIDFLNSVKASF